MRPRIGIAALALLVAAAILAVAPSAPAQTTDADAKAAAAVPEEIPAAEKARANPRPVVEQSLENGRQIYSSQCAMCHGKSGDGRGDLVERLNLTVPDFRSKSWHGDRTDGQMFFVITHGHGRMKGEGQRFSEDTKWDLVNYIRSLGAPG